MKRIALLSLVACVAVGGGCDWFKKKEEPKSEVIVTPPQPPRAIVKRVPCKLKFGPLAAALEVDLSEVRNIGLDAAQLYREIVSGEPGVTPPPPESPVVMVVNKKYNQFTYFTLNSNVKELRVRTKNSAEVQLNVKNQDPLRVELWVNTDEPIDMDVEFKDQSVVQPKS